MSFLTVARRRLVFFCAMSVVWLCSFYFLFSLFSGNRGVLRLFVLNNEISECDREIEYLTKEKLTLDARVAGLHEDSLDLDLLNECVRNVLGYAEDGESLIFIGK